MALQMVQRLSLCSLFFCVFLGSGLCSVPLDTLDSGVVGTCYVAHMCQPSAHRE